MNSTQNTTSDQQEIAQAKREKANGDIDAWFYAGCPIGKNYAKWSAK